MTEDLSRSLREDVEPDHEPEHDFPDLLSSYFMMCILRLLQFWGHSLPSQQDPETGPEHQLNSSSMLMLCGCLRICQDLERNEPSMHQLRDHTRQLSDEAHEERSMDSWSAEVMGRKVPVLFQGFLR